MQTQEARDLNDDRTTQEMASRLRGALHRLSTALSRQHNTVSHQLATRTARMESKIDIDVKREDQQQVRAEKRQDAYKKRITAALEDERTAIEQESAKMGAQLASLSKAISSSESSDEVYMHRDSASEEQERHKDYMGFTQQVQAQMKQLQQNKQQLEMELDGLMAVSESKDTQVSKQVEHLERVASDLQIQVMANLQTCVRPTRDT